MLKKILPHSGRALSLINCAYFYPERRELVATKVLTPLADQQSGFESTDWMFDGHFDGNSVLPGHFLDEMACLSAAVLHSFVGRAGGLPVVRKKDRIEYFAVVKPGDSLMIRVFNGNIPKPGHFSCSAEIMNHRDELVARIAYIYGRDLSALNRRQGKKPSECF